jgi:Asp/Glu/hydantoin racemase
VATIGFLHTADAHLPVFRALHAELAPAGRDVHVVDPTLLADARPDGLAPALSARIEGRLRELTGAGAEVIVCTCSTIGGGTERLAAAAGVPVLRGDRPMAEAATAAGSRIAVVYSVRSTLEPTRALLEESARGAVTIIPVPCLAAWPAFESDDLAAYARMVAETARGAATEADVIVLAQASMTPAADLLTDLAVPVLTSPRSAVERAVATTVEQAAATSQP